MGTEIFSMRDFDTTRQVLYLVEAIQRQTGGVCKLTCECGFTATRISKYCDFFHIAPQRLQNGPREAVNKNPPLGRVNNY